MTPTSDSSSVDDKSRGDRSDDKSRGESTVSDDKPRDESTAPGTGSERSLDQASSKRLMLRRILNKIVRGGSTATSTDASIGSSRTPGLTVPHDLTSGETTPTVAAGSTVVVVAGSTIGTQTVPPVQTVPPAQTVSTAPPVQTAPPAPSVQTVPPAQTVPPVSTAPPVQTVPPVPPTKKSTWRNLTAIWPGSDQPKHDYPRNTPPATPSTTTSSPTTPSTTLADGSYEPLVEGYEGVDYEIVSVGRGPGTRGAVLVLVLMLGVALFAGIRTFDWLHQKLDPPGDATDSVLVVLPPGSSTSGISELLVETGVIPDAIAYEWYVRLRGGPAFQAGGYLFQQNSSVWEALEVLAAGPTQVEQAQQLSITIPEGLTIAQMAALIDRKDDLQFSGADFLAALDNNPAASAIAPPPDDQISGVINASEGALFGDTYFLRPTATAAQLIAAMLAETDVVLEELGYADSVTRVGSTPYEVLVVASIVEGEASRPEDRVKLARVIYNRIAQGITLGMDATVSYLIGGGDIDAAALAIDSPYNTRLNSGLPPTPISSPSRESLAAAINPEPGDWLFVVKTEADGTLSFSVEYSDFLVDRERCLELGFCG